MKKLYLNVIGRETRYVNDWYSNRHNTTLQNIFFYGEWFYGDDFYRTDQTFRNSVPQGFQIFPGRLLNSETSLSYKQEDNAFLLFNT